MDRRRYLASVVAVASALGGCGESGRGGGNADRPTGTTAAPAESATPTAVPGTAVSTATPTEERTATPTEETRRAVDAAIEALRRASGVLDEGAGQFEGYRTDVDFDPAEARDHLDEAEASLDDAASSAASERGRTAVDALGEVVAFFRSVVDLLVTLTEASIAADEAIVALDADRMGTAIPALDRAQEGFDAARESASALHADVDRLHPEAVDETMDVDPDELRQRVEELAAHATALYVYTAGLRDLASSGRDYHPAWEALETDSYVEAIDLWSAARDAAARATATFEDGTAEVAAAYEPVIATLARATALFGALAATMADVAAVVEHVDAASDYRDAEQFDAAVEELETARGPLEDAETSFEPVRTLRDRLTPAGIRETRVFDYSSLIAGTRSVEGYLTALGALVPGSIEYVDGLRVVDSAVATYESGEYDAAVEGFADANERFDAAHATLTDVSLYDESPPDLRSAVRRVRCRSAAYRDATAHAREAAQAADDGDTDTRRRQEGLIEEAIQSLDECG